MIQKMNNLNQLIQLQNYFLPHWLQFDTEIQGVKLNRDQPPIIPTIHIHRRVSDCCKHAAGKNYVASVIAIMLLWFFVLTKVLAYAFTS
jgi:hypothetical protein